MKKILALLIMLVLLSPLALANQEQNKEQIRERNENIQQIREQALTQIRELKAENAAEVKAIVQQKREELKQAVTAEKKRVREIKQKQNEVRLAVHALLASENLTGGIGPQVSTIARDFDNSAKETEQAEEKAMNRGRFMKFLFGGDRESAEIIRNRVQTREEKIQQLEQLTETCDCNEETKQMLREQVQVMKQEQERLKEVTKNEEKKGLLGWLSK